MVKASDIALHQFLWDDVVRFYTAAWVPRFDVWKTRRSLDLQDELESTSDFLVKLNLKATPDLMEPPITMYNRDVFRPLYTGSILSAMTLSAVLCESNGLIKEARLSLKEYGTSLGKEGYPARSSRMWE